jgi:hypothetical protein
VASHPEEERKQEQVLEVREREPEEEHVGAEVERLEERLRNQVTGAREEDDLEPEGEEHRPAVPEFDVEDARGLAAEKQGKGNAQEDAREEEHLARRNGRRRKTESRCGRPAMRAGHPVHQWASST